MGKVYTVQVRAVAKIVNFAGRYGVKPQSLYDRIQLDPSVLTDPDRRIPFAQLVSLYENAAVLTGDKCFGLHLGESIDPTVFDLIGYIALNSPTVGDAFARVARYHSIWTDGSRFALKETNTSAKISYTYLDRSIAEHRQDAEITFAAFTTLRSVVANSDWAPLEVRFEHAEPGDTSEHSRIFRCPVRFNSTVNEFVLDTATLALPIAKADPRLCAVLDRHAEELLARYPREDSLVERVRTLIKDELNGGNASLDYVAEQLGMSGRTLQRKLREHGTSHQELLDQMRKDLAMRYLQEREMAICEVAYLLGFSESSALHRAFKRWTGMTPNAFRGR